jgi:hypothetical protein
MANQVLGQDGKGWPPAVISNQWNQITCISFFWLAKGVAV